MRLGDTDELIFTSGQPAIRATKIRYYTEPILKTTSRPATGRRAIGSNHVEKADGTVPAEIAGRNEAQPEPVPVRSRALVMGSSRRSEVRRGQADQRATHEKGRLL